MPQHTVFLECGPLVGAHVFEASELPDEVSIEVAGYRLTFTRHPTRRQFLALGYAPVYVCGSIREGMSDRPLPSTA